MNEKDFETAMKLVMFGGDAKACAIEAIEAAKKGDFEKAEERIAKAGESILEAHHSQTEMLTKEAGGEHMEVTLLSVHAQDHLMTAIAFTDLAKEIVLLYKKIS
ncbi:MAG: PTS lactose/cellobiose transporter subunit IIA [Hungatella sp.]|jgi:PTS system cellobiose-specific IIA component|nr:PTS lactose/cellobiose transporter subunit IIA [Hungatella sp.]